MDKISQIGSFAKSPDGQVVTVDVFQKMIDVGRGEFAPGIRSLATRSGHTVNRVDKGVYEIVGIGLRLTSDAPDAP
jgi:hypothetical protein